MFQKVCSLYCCVFDVIYVISSSSRCVMELPRHHFLLRFEWDPEGCHYVV